MGLTGGTMTSSIRSTGAAARSRGKLLLAAGTVSLWNQSHPDIHVNLNEVTSGNAGSYAKMFSAVQADRTPAAAELPVSRGRTFRPGGRQFD
jgi:hypothetical protein